MHSYCFSAFCPLQDVFICHILSMAFSNDPSMSKIRSYSRMATYIYIYIYTYIHIYIYVCIYICVYKHANAYVPLQTLTFLNTYIRTYVHTYVSTHANAYELTCVFGSSCFLVLGMVLSGVSSSRSIWRAYTPAFKIHIRSVGPWRLDHTEARGRFLLRAFT